MKKNYKIWRFLSFRKHFWENYNIALPICYFKTENTALRFAGTQQLLRVGLIHYFFFFLIFFVFFFFSDSFFFVGYAYCFFRFLFFIYTRQILLTFQFLARPLFEVLLPVVSPRCFKYLVLTEELRSNIFRRFFIYMELR